MARPTASQPQSLQPSTTLDPLSHEWGFADDGRVLIPYPTASADIEGMHIAGFPNEVSLFERVIHETTKAGQSVIYYLNIHVANTAYQNARLKRILQEADLVYCDGAGIVVGSKLLGTPLPTRLTAADWFLDMLGYYAKSDKRVYLLGGEPGVPEAAMEVITRKVPDNSIVGTHHGYILKDPILSQQVIDDINAMRPDILIVGFGTPLQEFWVEENRHRLEVPVVYAIGAVMDFISGHVPRCPEWMGKAGLEWLYRLYSDPSRLGARYVLGNPWFLSRMGLKAGLQRLNNRGKAKKTPIST